jgi:hypothetical protein
VGRQRGRRQQARRAHPQARQRRQRPGVAVELAQVGQAVDGRPALVLHDLLDRDPAPQCGGQDAAGAGADDQVQGAQRSAQPLLQRDQGSGRPGAAENPARTQHKTNPWTLPGYVHFRLRTWPGVVDRGRSP